MSDDQVTVAGQTVQWSRQASGKIKAKMAGTPGHWAIGDTRSEALGELIRACPERFACRKEGTA